MNKILKWILHPIYREPDFIVGKPEDPYLLRWFIWKKSWFKYFKIYLHKFCKSDWDRALHDHPSKSISFLIKGEYREITPNGIKYWCAPSIIFRDEKTPHRIELIDDKPAWTIFIFGKHLKEWGFWCPKGWVHWKEFVDEHDHGNVGKGCPE